MVKSDVPRNLKDVHIPPEWKRTQLVEVIKDISMGPFGSDITISNFTSSGVPVLNGKNISAVRLTDDIANYVTELKAYSLKKAVARRGDVVVTHRGTLGQIAYIPENSKHCKYVISQSQFRITFIDTIYVPFLVYFFHSPQGQSCLLEGRGHTGVPAIAQPTTTFRKIYVHLPPRHEQTAIAEALSDADSLIAALQELIAKKKAIKQGAMQELLTGKRRLPGFSGEWVTKKINEIAQPSIEKNTAGENLEVLTCSKHLGFVRSLEYFKNQVFSKDTSGYKVIYRDQIGYPANHIEEGAIGIQDICDKGLVSPIYIVFEVNPDEANSFFIYRQLKLERYRQIFSTATCSSVDRRGSLRWPAFSEIEIILPPLAEQQEIAQTLSDMDTEVEQLERKLSKYQQIKQGMMQELLTGRIRLIKTEAEQKQFTPAKKHNQQFDDAVMIAGIVDAFYSDKYPLGRKKVQKLLYLVRRKEEADVSAFQKKAAGPYADAVRYKGGEPIAKKSNYVIAQTSSKGTMFSRGAKIEQALGYIQSWDKQADIDWLVTNFQRTRVDDLELFATVDMAICDLREAHQPISVQSIKGLIHSTEEWRKKLDKDYFSDQDIQRAINKCRELFGEQ